MLHAPERRDPQSVLVVFDRDEVRDWLDVQCTPYLIYCFHPAKHSSAPHSKHLSFNMSYKYSICILLSSSRLWSQLLRSCHTSKACMSPDEHECSCR